MFPRGYRTFLLTLGLLLAASPGFAQLGIISGTVTGEDGNPMQGAIIKIERQDIRGNYQVKTNQKGEYIHAALPAGNYNVMLTVNDQTVDMVTNVRTRLGAGMTVNFDLAEVAKKRQEQQVQQQGGELPDEVVRAMSPEERQKYEAALKQRREAIGKGEDLNKAFNAGMEALKTQNYEVATENLAKAAEVDPTQAVVWANLGEAQSRLSQSRTGDERSQLAGQAAESYRKAIELQPANGGFYNNLGLALVRSGQLEEGQAQFVRAAEVDPTNGARYYFNLGAIMINSGNSQPAADAFRKATELDPKYADAYYQLGTTLVGAAEIGEDGAIKPVPGTIEAFQKYLELAPNGPNAAGAQSMIDTLTGGVQTSVGKN